MILDNVYNVVRAIKNNEEVDRKDFKIFKNYVRKKFNYNKDDGLSEVIFLIMQREFTPSREYTSGQISNFVVDVIRGFTDAKTEIDKRHDK